MRAICITAATLVAALLVVPARAQPAASQFTVLAQADPTIVAQSGAETVSLHTRIGADCIAAVVYDDGTAAPPLARQHVGKTGIVQWRFSVHTSSIGGSLVGACTWKGQQQIAVAHFSLAGAAQPTVALPEGPYPTYHADMLYVTPYRIQPNASLGTFTTPSDGNEFLVVWIWAMNRNDIALSSGGSEFHVTTSDGQVQDANFESLSPIYGGTIVPGASMKGSITFEVPKGSHTAQLKWVTNQYDSSWPTFTWSLHY